MGGRTALQLPVPVSGRLSVAATDYGGASCRRWGTAGRTVTHTGPGWGSWRPPLTPASTRDHSQFTCYGRPCGETPQAPSSHALPPGCTRPPGPIRGSPSPPSTKPGPPALHMCLACLVSATSAWGGPGGQGRPCSSPGRGHRWRPEATVHTAYGGGGHGALGRGWWAPEGAVQTRPHPRPYSTPRLRPSHRAPCPP